MKFLKFLVLVFISTTILFANTDIENNDLELQTKTQIKKLLQSKKHKSIFFISKYKLRLYYKAFDYKLIWSNEKGIKNIALDLLENVKQDPVLKPHLSSIFKIELLVNELNSLDTSNEKYLESMTKIDFMLTGIYSTYVNYLARGFIDWKAFKEKIALIKEEQDITLNWEKYSVRKNRIKLLQKAVENDDIQLAIKEVNFNFPIANKLKDKLKELEKLEANGGYIQLPYFKVLKEGSSSKVVKQLRQRLLQDNYILANNCELTVDAQHFVTNNIELKEETITHTDSLEVDCLEKFDKNLKESIIQFQTNHGLEADGIVGSQTRKHLNISVKEKIQKIRLNLERMRWMPRSLGEKYLLVNIPEYKLRMFENDEVKLHMDIVVGTKKHPTPVFSNKVSFIVLNPYWRIPESIVKEEIVPKVIENPNYLNEKGINIHENWDHESQIIALEDVDLELYKVEEKIKEDEENTLITEELSVFEPPIEEIEKEEVELYKFIQIPNASNPLGRMKFMFPNRYSVYLHDSPAKEFFKQRVRAYSHGCVRLAEPKKLLEAIANADENLDYEQANEVLKETEKMSVDLSKNIPVHLVYLTTWVNEEGFLQFRDDIYGLDKIQSEILYKNN